MKKSFVKVTFVSALVLLAGSMFAGSLQDENNGKRNSTSNRNMAPNGNYKHQMPTSEGNKFKDSFTKAEKESINRNYKQQNQEKRNVKFKDHFGKPEKTNRRSYKHPQGL